MQDAQLSSASPSPPGARRFAGLRRRFPRQVNWLEARFSPEGYLGLHLTVGVLMLLSMAWLFGAIAEDVVTGDPIVLLDQRVAEWFNEHGTPAFFKVMTVITFFGCGEWVHSVAGIAAALLAWKRAWYRLLILLLTVPCGGLLNTLLKWAFHRDRPVVAHPLLTLDTYSFPSGHTMGATLLYGLAAVLACHHVRTWRARAWIVAAASCAVFLVALSRAALGAHFVSDVIGATFAGVAWLAICVTSVETLRRRRLLSSGGGKSRKPDVRS